jgi:1,4-dihydroxy-2-naphthoate octaprenyltransferase
MRAATASLVSQRGLLEAASVYARLGNMKVYIQWLPGLIGWSVVAHQVGVSGAALGPLVLFVLACVACAACGGALDHLQGFRDGIDQQTYGSYDYGSSDALGGYQTKSDAAIKPLVTGEIGPPEARRFGIAMGIVSFGLGSVAIELAPYHAWWLVGVWGMCVVASSQYAYGVKVSYWGPAELLLGVEIAVAVILPQLFLSGGLTSTGAFEAYLIGTLFPHVTLFSMIFDREADASAGRLTLAVRMSPRAYRALVGAWIAVGWIVALVGLASGSLDPWLGVAWAPVWAMQVAQLAYGVLADRPLTARLIGWHAFNVALVTFTVTNLLTR